MEFTIGTRLPMPHDKKVPATIPPNSALPQGHSSSLVARGLAAVQQSLAALEKEDAESLFRKGMRYRNGEGGTPKDDDKARTYLFAAAKLNHAEAQFELSLLLHEEDGERHDVSPRFRSPSVPSGGARSGVGSACSLGAGHTFRYTQAAGLRSRDSTALAECIHLDCGYNA